MERNNLGELMLNNGCEDVLKYLTNACQVAIDFKNNRILSFEGENVSIEIVCPQDGIICFGNKNFPNYAFFIGKDNGNRNFPVVAFKNGVYTEVQLGILLPSYVRNELVATAMGKW